MNRLVESGKVVSAFVPIDTTSAIQSGDWVSLKNYGHCTVIIQQGAWAGGTPAVTLEQATAVAGTGGKALAFDKFFAGVALTDDNYAETAVVANTFNLPAVANSVSIIEINADDLDMNGGFDCMRVVVASPGANADLISAHYVLSKPRYSQSDPPSCIVD